MIIPVNLFFFQHLPQQKPKADPVSALLQQATISVNLPAMPPPKKNQFKKSCKIAACAAH